MKRKKHHENEENEDKGSHDHNNHETENEDNIDILSNLPNCLLIHILSLLNVKEAVQTCILSSSWVHLWKHLNITSLKLHCSDFDISFFCSCQSLTSINIGSQYDFYLKKFPNSLNIPTLTYLKLSLFTFYTGSDGRVEPFSTFKKLDTLILYCCTVHDQQKPLCISSTTLLNVEIDSQLVFSGFLNIELFTPNICFFALTCNFFPKVSGSHLSLIQHVIIDAWDCELMPQARLDLLGFLIELTNIKSLSVTPTTLEALSLVSGILELKLNSLCNLESLDLELDLDRFPETTYRRDVEVELENGKSWEENAKLREAVKGGLLSKYSSILDGMIEFLLQNSPLAKVDILLDS